MEYGQAKAILEFKEQENIIKDYCEKYPKCDFYFNLDGIVNINEWYKDTNKKVCFFLKESYRGKSNAYLDSYIYPLVKELNDYNPWRMWKKAAKWSYLINSIENIESTEDIDFNYGDENEYIKKTAIMNIIKVIKNSDKTNEDQSVGNKTTKYKYLKKQMEKDAELLINQLETIKPKFVVCGNTFSLFIKLLMFRDKIIGEKDFLNNDYLGKNEKVDKYLKNFKAIDNTVYFNDEYVIIDTYHLAYPGYEQPSNNHIKCLKEYFEQESKAHEKRQNI